MAHSNDSRNAPVFAARTTTAEIEGGDTFQPKFDADGLIPAIVTDAESGEVLMFAWMNDAALLKTLCRGTAHFWSRSRQRLWQKGEESGNLLQVEEARTDCDQDVIWLKVRVAGDGKACHTGERSCFYRLIEDKAVRQSDNTGPGFSLRPAPER